MTWETRLAFYGSALVWGMAIGLGWAYVEDRDPNALIGCLFLIVAATWCTHLYFENRRMDRKERNRV